MISRGLAILFIGVVVGVCWFFTAHYTEAVDNPIADNSGHKGSELVEIVPIHTESQQVADEK
ncbi:hypothetical protein [Pseudalkalibacillus caeni]|uniref:Uncharacterized protein n=1 Tax=Exobacillus caeni TaxID=2574798 RepID=A0A5R9F794_9BACL|nr:hypothetical protein [Pseudalkalibacillus caeni]TLS38206.1 hypothetical protein FCL54_06625 [Pseudalkalibacillus caeni]